MKESYFEKKKKRNEILTVVIVLPIVLFLINYIFGFWMGLLFHWLSFGFIIGLDLLALWATGAYLGIKLPKKEKPAWLKEELSKLEDIYNNHVRAKEQSLEGSAKRYNENCPKCHNNDSRKIVDSIRETKGEVDGTFILGSGSISGETETKEVNHCNVCGHEWKKQEVGWEESWENAMNEILSGMYVFFDTGENIRVDQLKDFHAKAVKIFISKHQYGFRAEKLKKLSKNDLREYGCK